jgi:predicted lipoprotein with Yx(FWY)xxD motif
MKSLLAARYRAGHLRSVRAGAVVLLAGAAVAGSAAAAAASSSAAAGGAEPPVRAAAAGGPAALVKAAATTAPPGRRSAAIVVLQRSRRGFGKMLVTVSGRALYMLPRGSCAGQCLVIWPRLVMPAGKTRPAGASCLSIARYGSAGRLQVTYHGLRLYAFISDHGRSVTGNGADGFAVAKVIKCSSPLPSPSHTPSAPASPSPTPTGAW